MARQKSSFRSYFCENLTVKYVIIDDIFFFLFQSFQIEKNQKQVKKANRYQLLLRPAACSHKSSAISFWSCVVQERFGLRRA
eukprot:g11859.t1